jgi:hypothetical protein
MKLTIPEVPPSLNKFLNMHWRAQRKLRDKWILEVRAQMDMNKVWLKPIAKREAVKMKVFIMLVHSRFYDYDNACGGAKPVVDALKHWGLIYDDSRELLELIVEQGLCPHAKRHTIIELEPA